jgi:hypothetical protein
VLKEERLPEIQQKEADAAKPPEKTTQDRVAEYVKEVGVLAANRENAEKTCRDALEQWSSDPNIGPDLAKEMVDQLRSDILSGAYEDL